MSRLSLAVINQLFETLRILQADFNELKNRQPTSGRSGVLGYLSQTDNEWDATGNLSSPSTSFGLSAEFEIAFTGDGSQRYPVLNAFADLMFSSKINPTPTKPTYNTSNGFLTWTDGTNGVVVNAFVDELAGNEASLYLYKWNVSFSFFGDMTYYLKAYTRGTSRGSIVVTRTY